MREIELGERLGSNRGLGIMVKKCLYEGVIVPTEKRRRRGAEAWGMRSAD